jgi:hypothetical protein
VNDALSMDLLYFFLTQMNGSCNIINETDNVAGGIFHYVGYMNSSGMELMSMIKHVGYLELHVSTN